MQFIQPLVNNQNLIPRKENILVLFYIILYQQQENVFRDDGGFVFWIKYDQY